MSPVVQQPDLPCTPSMDKGYAAAHTIQLCTQAVRHMRRFKIRMNTNSTFPSKKLTLKECRVFSRSMEIKPFQYHKMRFWM